MSKEHWVIVTVNGKEYLRCVEPRLLLSDVLRHTLHLTGTHLGCEHGICGACAVTLDGSSARSCLMFTVQADGLGRRPLKVLGPRKNRARFRRVFAKSTVCSAAFARLEC